MRAVAEQHSVFCGRPDVAIAAVATSSFCSSLLLCHTSEKNSVSDVDAHGGTRLGLQGLGSPTTWDSLSEGCAETFHANCVSW